MKKKVYITQDSPLGKICKNIAELPKGWVFAKTPEECDVYISLFSKTIIKEDFIKGRRCYNFHGGILPKYRGVGTCSFVILNGEKETGITLHKMDAGIDTGDIISIEKTEITEEDTAETLFNRCQNIAELMFEKWFQKLLLQKYKAKKQTETYPLYTRKMLEQAKDITRIYRAFSFEGKEQAYYYKKDKSKNYLK